MHAYFLTRGIKQDIDLFVKFLETRAMKLPFTKDGKEYTIPLQGALRPIQLWEYVFPENEKDAVFTTLNMDSNPHPNNFKMKLGIKALRKALGASKVPKFDKKRKLFIPDNLAISIVPIGIRKDKYQDFGGEEGFHEAL